ncbi:uncharacterized protein LOC110105435 [Dendrobium catenatum]|uniref:SOSEKI DIX-like domain-containing protein n=1 Tax=Dendrobium catenatum TaxID=906689 RepID=A0A2I0WUA1_9ASPA|nr:uncharacterized protein LOC110105435 [Dendrobium catenatum]PKU79240.1 hypothetical protein MA16_Dca000584 [Dendrobium catenatum]
MDPLKRRSAEARRANVIYFLNRNGHIEHPHLIRIHHFCHSGVHLREFDRHADVKRWLSELRGKEMPDSFTWSYQRRYKEGFVWQDLVDDDLITPISNYEYVLLGSLHISASSFPAEAAVAVPTTTTTATDAESKSDFFPFPEVDTSPEKDELFVVDSVSTALKTPDEEPLPKEKVEDLGKSPAIVAGGRRYSWRASYLLRNFLTCSAVETADSAVLHTPRRIIAAAAAGGHGADRGPHGQVTKTVGSTRPILRRHSSYECNNST